MSQRTGDVILYHCVGTRSLRVLWTLEELALPYELRVLPFPPRQAAKWYLGENILGTVPLLVDGALRMTESSAICQYLCTKSNSELALQRHEPGYADFLEWVHFGEATLAYCLAVAARYSVMEPQERRLPQAVDDHLAKFFGRLRAIEARLEVTPFLAGDRFTVADIAVGFALHMCDLLDLRGKVPSNIQSYWQHISSRDAFLRARDIERTAGFYEPDTLQL